ncbi:hypothetical protein GF386_05520 [Candidatus Pacearchaeota archaeon]|nr:hypothetical protein [Candidatus Pacearchaeota archaeon]MBD3283559.1 hypothetical protein [Candidatus Pacearchaeota archaeon]
MGSRIKKSKSSFIPTHQPVYEALTFAMVNNLGLHTSDYYLLQNPHGNLPFKLETGIKTNIRSGMPFYFVSKLMECEGLDDVREASALVSDEMIYLDLLQVSDIVGRPQNYCYIDGKVFYLDLGCSFVDAHEGRLELHNKHGKPLSRKQLRKSLKELERYSIVGKGGYRSMTLADFAEMPRYLRIPTLNPRGRVSLTSLITEEEIEEIVSRLAFSAKKTLDSYKGSEYLMRTNNNH